MHSGRGFEGSRKLISSVLIGFGMFFFFLKLPFEFSSRRALPLKILKIVRSAEISGSAGIIFKYLSCAEYFFLEILKLYLSYS